MTALNELIQHVLNLLQLKTADFVVLRSQNLQVTGRTIVPHEPGEKPGWVLDIRVLGEEASGVAPPAGLKGGAATTAASRPQRIEEAMQPKKEVTRGNGNGN